MAYTRQPNSVLAGRALAQTPGPEPVAPAGVLPVVLNANIATTTSLGVVQIGNNINIDSNGVISTSSTTDLISVKLIAVDYIASDVDYYIGATEKNITVTLPSGIIGKVYYIKNQSNGNITVTGVNGQTLDDSGFKILGNEAGIICVFDGTRWNII